MKLLLNSSYGEQVRKDSEEKYACKSEYWLSTETENDERVKNYWKLLHGNNVAKIVEDEGLEDVVKKLNTMP